MSPPPSQNFVAKGKSNHKGDSLRATNNVFKILRFQLDLQITLAQMVSNATSLTDILDDRDPETIIFS